MSKFKVGDEVRVVKKCEFQAHEPNTWVRSMDKYIGKQGVVCRVSTLGIRVEFKAERWNFPSQSLELIEHTNTEDEQKYVVLAWGYENNTKYYGAVCFAEDGYTKFIGTKKEAKSRRDYLREQYPDVTYKIAKYPFNI